MEPEERTLVNISIDLEDHEDKRRSLVRQIQALNTELSEVEERLTLLRAEQERYFERMKNAGT